MTILSVLTIVFVVLKLLAVINWSWIWVLSPIWLGILIWILGVALACILNFNIYDKY